MEGKPERSAQMADKKLTRMTPEAIKAQLARRSPQAVTEARKRYDETTEEDIQRHMREDDADLEDDATVDARLTVSANWCGKDCV